MPPPLSWLAHSPGNFSFLRGFRPYGRMRRLVLGRRRRSRMRRVSIQTSSPEIRTVITSDFSFCGGYWPAVSQTSQA